MSRFNIHGNIPFIDRETCKSCKLFSNEFQKGKVYTKKELILCGDIIDVFHEKYYCPSITKLAYHLAHVSILGTNHVGATRRDALKCHMTCKDIKCRRGYAERLSAIFGTQIQSEYYGTKASLSIEDVDMEYYKEEEDDGIENSQKEYQSKCEFPPTFLRIVIKMQQLLTCIYP